MAWWTRFFRKKVTKLPHELIERKKLDSDKIKLRLHNLGWVVREIPVRKQQTIAAWRLIAMRGDKSVDVSGKTIDESFNILGKTLGVISLKD